jgi:hypothetical protein
MTLRGHGGLPASSTSLRLNIQRPSQALVREAGDAKKVRQQLLDFGALSNFTVKTAPTIIEIADQATY